jgi:hypothetical protein
MYFSADTRQSDIQLPQSHRRTSPDGDVEDRGPRVDALHVQRRERREPLRGLRERVCHCEQLRAVRVLVLRRRRLEALVLVCGRGGRCALGGVSTRGGRAGGACLSWCPCRPELSPPRPSSLSA